jgi:hypothetical protein
MVPEFLLRKNPGTGPCQNPFYEEMMEWMATFLLRRNVAIRRPCLFYEET